MTEIYVVRKHKITRHKYFIDGLSYYNAFEIHGAYAMKKEAKVEAEKKNAKSRDYIYLVGKVAVK
jgi:hypothetical protein